MFRRLELPRRSRQDATILVDYLNGRVAEAETVIRDGGLALQNPSGTHLSAMVQDRIGRMLEAAAEIEVLIETLDQIRQLGVAQTRENLVEALARRASDTAFRTEPTSQISRQLETAVYANLVAFLAE